MDWSLIIVLAVSGLFTSLWIEYKIGDLNQRIVALESKLSQAVVSSTTQAHEFQISSLLQQYLAGDVGFTGLQQQFHSLGGNSSERFKSVGELIASFKPYPFDGEANAKAEQALKEKLKVFV